MREETKANRIKERLHILEGFIFAVEHPAEILEIMVAGEDVQAIKEKLYNEFCMSEMQAQAIIDMRMRAFSGCEKKKLYEEYTGCEEYLLNFIRKTPEPRIESE